MSMRFVVISTLYPPYSRGGAERVAEMTVRGLRDAGHEVLVITAGPKGSEANEEKDGVRIHRVLPPNLFFYGEMGSQSFWKRLIFHIRDANNKASAKIVRDILEKEKPDAVITENIKGIGFAVPRVIRELGIRHIHVLHDIQLIEPSGLVCAPEIASTPIRRLWSAWTRRLWGSPEVVVCPSQWIADVHRAWGFFSASSMEVISNPIEPYGLIRTNKPMEEVGARLVFVGQNEEHKGVADVIEAARVVDGDFVLDIVGDGSRREDLVRRIVGDRRIVFHGHVAPERLPEFYSRAAATIVPSRCMENAPTTIAESLAHGTPVIASRVGGIPEMIRDGENGWLVPPGDVQALAAAMENALKQKNDPALRDRALRSVEGRTVADYVQKISSLVPAPAAPFRE